MKQLHIMSLSVFFLIGCGGDTTSGQFPTLGSVKFTWLKQGDCSLTNNSVRGSCHLMFANTTEEDVKISLKTELPQLGSLTVLSHSDLQGKDGIAITFTRTETDKWDISYTVRGQGPYQVTDFDTNNSSGPHSLEVDIHGHGDFKISIDNTPSNFLDLAGMSVPLRNAGLILSNAYVEGVVIGEATPH